MMVGKPGPIRLYIAPIDALFVRTVVSDSFSWWSMQSCTIACGVSLDPLDFNSLSASVWETILLDKAVYRSLGLSQFEKGQMPRLH